MNTTKTYGLAIAALANFPVTPLLIRGAIATLQAAPSIWCRLPAIYQDEVSLPATSNRDYSVPRLADRKPDTDPGVERWFIESPAMRRIVEVQIQAAKQPHAPMLYLLDGITAPKRSGWLREGQLHYALKDENVTVVMPTEAAGSLYDDWHADDPYLGRNQWRTFLTSELPAVLEDPAVGLSFNGTRIIAGLSMGAAAAVRLAAQHPTVFHGVIGLSGCYSTTSAMGWGMTLSIIRGVGGDPDNIWTTEQRFAADVIRYPLMLKDTPVYLFASDGKVTAFDIEKHLGRPAIELPGAVLLECASYTCTKELDQAMRNVGLTHQVVCYQQGGVHDWAYYGEQLKKGWNTVYSQHLEKVL
jgi:hypothetical protein